MPGHSLSARAALPCCNTIARTLKRWSRRSTTGNQPVSKGTNPWFCDHIPGMLILSIGCFFCHLLNLPDRIDFWREKGRLKKIIADHSDDKVRWVEVSPYYETLYPQRVPLIYDSRIYAFGTKQQIDKMEARWAGYHFVQVDKEGWYILYVENIYDPDQM